MKTYKVLEAHQGDKAYAVGDPRIADPNTVGHLVALGLLEEVGDAAEPAKAVPAHETKIVELEGAVAALTAERDDARAAVLSMTQDRDAAVEDLAMAREALAAAQAERDEARDALAASKEAAGAGQQVQPGRAGRGRGSN